MNALKNVWLGICAITQVGQKQVCIGDKQIMVITKNLILLQSWLNDEHFCELYLVSSFSLCHLLHKLLNKMAMLSFIETLTNKNQFLVLNLPTKLSLEIHPMVCKRISAQSNCVCFLEELKSFFHILNGCNFVNCYKLETCCGFPCHITIHWGNRKTNAE